MKAKMERTGQAPYSPEVVEGLMDEFFGEDVREQKEINYIKVLLKNCDRFLDVGANIGQYIYLANTVMKDSDIVGIEANPNLLPILNEIVVKTKEEFKNNNKIEIFENAVIDGEHDVTFFITDEITTSSIFDVARESHKVTVQGKPLDHFYVPSEKTVIKMDIEGAEYQAVASGKRFLASNHTIFFLELHGWGDPVQRKYPLQVATLFYVNGYRMRKIGSHYLFERAGVTACIFGFLANLPLLGTKWLVYRYAKGLVPWIRRVRSALQR